MGNQASSRHWYETAEKIKEYYIKAFTDIEKGITCEENEKPHEALKYYKLGIYHIDQALKIPVEYPENVMDDSFKEAVAMVQKMKGTRGEVLQRITQIMKSPAYEKEKSASPELGTEGSITYSDLAKALENLKSSTLRSESTAVEVFKCNDVKIFQIKADGTVTSHTIEPELSVVKITDNRDHTYSMKAGEWVYPLIPGVSPCYRAKFKAFIFPDLFSTIPGNAIGLVVPEKFDDQLLSLLEDILHGIVYQGAESHSLSVKKEVPAGDVKPCTTAESIVYGLTTGAKYVSWGLLKGAEKTSNLMNYVTPKIISNMRPANDAQQEVVSEKVTSGINVARNVTGAAVEVTGFVADKVSLATVALGRFLAPHIQKQGTKVLQSGFNLSEEDAKSKMGGILTMASGAVEGFATVYSGLEQSASILGENFKNNTVKVVEHKYGPKVAGALTKPL
ncbi:protein spartin isoform X2 [Ctenocephalides felis]|uniref:protein spartin isoform X2 n=1 Tax=Ctenocephalides felis TaxID=7515 RepID=UPI000E6E3A64|nr:protein spartin isoform X2 [Ctenocephalides felis]